VAIPNVKRIFCLLVVYGTHAKIDFSHVWHRKGLAMNVVEPSTFFIWADFVIKCWVQLFEAIPQCHHRELPNQVSHLEGGTGDRKLVCDQSFAPLLCICSRLRAPSPIFSPTCALFSPMPVHRRFSLTQESHSQWCGAWRWNKCVKARSTVFFCYSVFYLWSAQKAAVVLDLSRSFHSSSASGTKGCLDLSSR